MTRTPTQGPVVEIKPQPSIYTVLLVVAILSILIAVALGLHTLMAESPAGYGLKFGQLFEPLTRSLPAK